MSVETSADAVIAGRIESERETGLTYRHEGLPLIRDDKGRPIWCAANAIMLLTDHEAWAGVLALNQFTQRRVLLKPIPGQSGGQYPRPVEDDDYVAAQAWFNVTGFPKASADIVTNALRKVCREQPFDPLKAYLNGLEWDGTDRLRTWLTRYCGAEASDYASEVGLRWCISAVARGLKPGCKVDCMLVLEGAQGRRKSSALAALAGPDWFSDALPHMGSKDASSYLRGRWIVEVGELEAMRKDVDMIKAFLSRQVETYRPAYAREEVTEPRRCVFAGTTNRSDWQKDETGGRRFWPIKVGEIDIPSLELDRDQLWAEAVHLFKSGERWWLEGHVAEQAAHEAAERRPDDPWRSNILHALEGKAEVTPKELLGEMGVLVSEMTPQLSKRISKELVAMGWEKVGRVPSGDHKGAALFRPSGEEKQW